MNRIRYAKSDKPEIQTSVKVYTGADGKEYRAYINSTTLAWGIVDMATQQVVSYGTGKTFVRTKAGAKDGLVALGVVFEKEKRKEEVLQSS